MPSFLKKLTISLNFSALSEGKIKLFMKSSSGKLNFKLFNNICIKSYLFISVYL